MEIKYFNQKLATQQGSGLSLFDCSQPEVKEIPVPSDRILQKELPAGRYQDICTVHSSLNILLVEVQI